PVFSTLNFCIEDFNQEIWNQRIEYSRLYLTLEEQLCMWTDALPINRRRSDSGRKIYFLEIKEFKKNSSETNAIRRLGPNLEVNPTENERK
ncbi:hypothetical protein AVEN_222362-1, partial [Araneus ventricosus]